MVISIPNGNYVELSAGDRISVEVTHVMESYPVQLIGKNIKVLNKTWTPDPFTQYEKIEELNITVSGETTTAYDMGGNPIECLQIKIHEDKNRGQEWEAVCDPIGKFNHQKGITKRLRVNRKWLKNHEFVADRSPYDWELIEIIEEGMETRSDLAVLTVTKIKKGRDGYTATLKNDKGDQFRVTVSIINNRDNYVTLKEGDQVKVTGRHEVSETGMIIIPEKIDILKSAPTNFVKGELLVGFKSKKTYKSAINELEKNKGVRLIKMLMEGSDAIVGHFQVPEGQEKIMIQVFQGHPQVKYAELNGIATINR